MSEINVHKNIKFLRGGGEMGELIRSKNWNNSSIGSIENWSPSLRTTLSIVLNSKFPMFLFWGPDLLCFYNDAYRPSLGNDGKHPHILGKPAEESWQETWHLIKPVINEIMAGGESTLNQDQVFTFNRNNHLESGYWTYCYSAVENELGEIVGVIVTCNETTKKVEAFEKLEINEKKLNFTIEATNLGIWSFNPNTRVFKCNNRLKKWFGIDENKDIDVETAIDRIVEKDREKTRNAMLAAMKTGSHGNYEVEHTVLNPITNQEYILLSKGKALFDENAKIIELSGTLQDITEQVIARRKLEESEEQLRFALEGGNLGYFNTYPQQDLIYWSDKTREFFGVTKNEEVNLQLYKSCVHADDIEKSQIIFQKAWNDKGKHLYENEYRTARTNKWLSVKGKITTDNTNEPFRVSGIIQDITENKLVEKRLLESEHRFRNMIYTSPNLISILKGENFIIEIANDAILDTWGKGNGVIGKPLLEALPELAEQGFGEILTQVYKTGVPYKAFDMPVTLLKEGVEKLGYYTFIYQVQRDLNDEIESIAIIATEVTQQAELNQKIQISEKLLRETKEQLELTFENVPASIFLYNNQKEILFANQRAANMLGYQNVEELLSYKYYDILMQKGMQDFYVQNQDNQSFGIEKLPTFSALKSKEHGEMVFSMQHKSGGNKTWYLNKSAPIFDDEGIISMVLTTSTDITAQKLAEETIRESENRFRLLSDNAPMWVWITDLDINILYANQEILKYVGLKHYSGFTGKVWQQIVHPEDIIIVMKSFQKSIAEQSTFDFEVRIKNAKAASYEWFYLKGIPRYENEEFIGFIGTGLNINQQKTFAQTLESEVEERTAELKIVNDMLFTRNEMLSISEDFNRNLTELSPNVVYINDLEENKFIFLNQTGLKLIGSTWEEIYGVGNQIQPLIIHPDDMNSVMETIEKVKKSKNEEVFEHEYRIKNADGNWTPILARDTAFKRNRNKEVTQLLGIAIDITEIKRAKTVLEQKNKELEKMNKELESFAYVSSHDLQEPLRKIQAFSSRLMEKEHENLSDSGKDYLRRMRLSGERMQQLIQDLLAYSRTKTSDRKFEKTDLGTVILDVIDDLKDELTLKNGSIIVGEVCDLNIIPFQFRQLIYNLTSNSLKFTKKDVAPIININCRIAKGFSFHYEHLLPETEYCYVSIVDNGIGFDSNYKDKIFEIFQRLHGREEYIGTGIGLAIVKKIVENHNGFISAEGEPNKGATFNIYIPV